jgi:hypothetical protein
MLLLSVLPSSFKGSVADHLRPFPCKDYLVRGEVSTLRGAALFRTQLLFPTCSLCLLVMTATISDQSTRRVGLPYFHYVANVQSTRSIYNYCVKPVFSSVPILLSFFVLFDYSAWETQYGLNWYLRSAITVDGICFIAL